MFGLNHIVNLSCPLFICVNVVILPVILAHKFGVRIETAPAVFIARKDSLNVLIVLFRTSRVLSHFFFRGFLLGK